LSRLAWSMIIMEIPTNLIVMPGERGVSSRRAGRRSNPEKTKKPQVQPAVVVEIASREPSRGSSEIPRTLAKAELCLRKITADLGGLNQAEIQKLHRLEGCIHIFPD